MGPEHFIKIFDRCQCADGVGMAAELADIQIFCFILLIIDFADDQFENIFDGYQT